uniref:N-acetylmuramoyl-L-alanine amidase n=1 Tax=Panagrellus redivivus TaxID=6233 RepID=A0A7E4W2A9_PANRE
MLKFILVTCLFVGLSVSDDLDYRIKFVKNFSEPQHFDFTFIAVKEFTINFLTKSNKSVFNVTSVDGRSLKFNFDDQERVLKKAGLKVGQEHTLNLDIHTQNNSVSIDKISFNTKIPLQKIRKVHTTGLTKYPSYDLSMSGPALTQLPNYEN